MLLSEGMIDEKGSKLHLGPQRASSPTFVNFYQQSERHSRPEQWRAHFLPCATSFVALPGVESYGLLAMAHM
jgi:hypothetical protein